MISKITKIQRPRTYVDLARRLSLTLLLATFHTTAESVAATAATACKPILTMTAVRAVRTPVLPVLPWNWKATIAADTTFCANTAGLFEVDFIRAKENSTDLQFTEKFSWQPGDFEVPVELAPDEYVLAYRIGFIASYICRELADNK